MRCGGHTHGAACAGKRTKGLYGNTHLLHGLSSFAPFLELFFLEPRRVPFVDLLLSDISCDSIPLLHLADKLVELEVVDSISDETVRLALEKTS